MLKGVGLSLRYFFPSLLNRDAFIEWHKRLLSTLHLTAELKFENRAAFDAAKRSGRPLVFVNLNQYSNIGSVALSSLLVEEMRSEVHFVINAKWALAPFFGWRMAIMHRLIVFKPLKWQAKRVIEKAAKKLRENRIGSVFVSVEGQRATSVGRLSPFKAGAAYLTRSSDAIAIPIVMSASCFHAMPYGAATVTGHHNLSFKLLEPLDGRDFASNAQMTDAFRKLASKEVENHT